MEKKTQDVLRTMNLILQESALEYSALTQELCTEFAKLLSTNVLVCRKDGTYASAAGEWFGQESAAQLAQLTPSKLLTLDGYKTNVSLRALHVLPDNESDRPAVVMPLRAKGAAIGTALFFKGKTFTDDELACVEWFAATAALLLGFQAVTQSGDDDRNRKAVRTALSALSYSEFEAVTSIFAELAANEGLVVASKIADKVGITRSVIVNALRKLESAVVIETRSLGMKGTYIRVINAYLFEELNRLKG